MKNTISQRENREFSSAGARFFMKKHADFPSETPDSSRRTLTENAP
jgi:hypothetical protein